METPSLFIQKVGVVLSGTMSHMTMSDMRKATCAKGRGKDINQRKVYSSISDVLSLIKNLNDYYFKPQIFCKQDFFSIITQNYCKGTSLSQTPTNTEKKCKYRY